MSCEADPPSIDGTTENVQNIAEILSPSSIPYLTDGFFTQHVSTALGDGLPYYKLGGPGLERLCYSLISSRGGIPRYFGNPGQQQYGIDLLTSDGAECTVYQCKNVATFTSQNMEKALQLFADRWLSHSQLPKPTKFVMCCPLELREQRENEQWTILEREFFKRTGVQTEVWHREYLDNQLRNLPDIVSDLFSVEVAERFCSVADWNEDIFRPVREGSGEPTVRRYWDKKQASKIYVDTRMSEFFTRQLGKHGNLLIVGLPGSGKSMTGLALAESFRRGVYRLYYINMRRDVTEDALVRGIRRRLTRPTIFLIDDCHGKYEILEGVRDRLHEIVARHSDKTFFVYMARATPTPDGVPRADSSDFVNKFKEDGAIWEFRTTKEIFGRIAALTKSELQDLSTERLDRLFTTAGRDLFLLDQILSAIDSPEGIDRLEPEHIFEETLRRYFGQRTVYRPGFMLLTALAQFEIAPTVADFPYDLRREDPTAATQLLMEADRPLRYFFLHSSAAELVFRALVWNDRIDNHVEVAALRLIEHFASRDATDPQLPSDLISVLRNRLKLRGPDDEEKLLKDRLLADDRIHGLIEVTYERLLLNGLTVPLNILKSTDGTTFDRYRDLVDRKINDGTTLTVLLRNFNRQFLQLTQDEYPSWYSTLQEQFADQGLRQLVQTRELQGLLRLLVKFAGQRDFILDKALDSITDDDSRELIDRTVASKRSIGEIALNLRELKKANLSFLERFEQKIGAQRYLFLIITAGTTSDLFTVIQQSTFPMAGQIADALDDEAIDKLIDNSIASGRSIGMINFALRQLKLFDPKTLDKVERKIGAIRWWRLILANAKINMVAPLIQHMDDSFSQEMVRASRRLTIADWKSLLLRGDFNDLTIFVRVSKGNARGLFTPALIKHLSSTFEKIIRQTDWAILYTSAYRLATARDSTLKEYLQSILSGYLGTIDLDALHFYTFEQGTQCVCSLWWGVPRMRDKIAQSLFSILPNENGWHREAGFLRNARGPLLILASSQADHESDTRMLHLCNKSEVATLFTTADTFDALLYLWNLYSLWFKHEKVIRTDGTATFSSFLDAEIRAVVNRTLDERLRRPADQAEKEYLVSLCGFLHASGLATFVPTDKTAWATRLPPFEKLLKAAEDIKSFLTHSFFLIGLGYIFDRSKDIPRETFSRFLVTMDPYQATTEAFRNLQRSLSKRVR